MGRFRAAIQALRRQPPVAHGGGAMTSIVRSLPAPVGGWNARDPLAKMPSIDAVTLENWFPRVADCVIRGGCMDQATGFAGRPKTLATYNGLNGVNKMFAATDGGIFDVSAVGAIGASVLARTQGYHSSVAMAVSGGLYLCMFNGIDKPAFFDGTTWIAVDGASAPAITGVTTTLLVTANVYKRRLFMLEVNKCNFWYLPADAIGGAATEFLLGPLVQRGGYAMAMGTWTIDTGYGPDDYAVFVTSEGEALIFTGTNPSDPNNWKLVGVYYTGKPLGRKCLKKLGGDLVLLTEYGALPLSRMVQSNTVDYSVAMSSRIDGAFTDATRSYGGNIGWMIEIFPAQAAMLVNVPTGINGISAQQYVMNTTTKRWCKFIGWNASEFIVYNKELYFCDQTKVAKAWTTKADYGVNIVANAQCAYTNFGDARTKDWGLFRPLLRVDGRLSFSVGVAVDFETMPVLSTAVYSVIGGAQWDVSLWDQGMWAAGLEVISDWRTPGARSGEYGAGLLKIATNSLIVQWAANDYSYTLGSVVT